MEPEFHPQNVASKDFLKYYARRLNAVEVNCTFRQLPKAARPPKVGFGYRNGNTLKTQLTQRRDAILV